jgi:hypothetical protein
VIMGKPEELLAEIQLFSNQWSRRIPQPMRGRVDYFVCRDLMYLIRLAICWLVSL